MASTLPTIISMLSCNRDATAKTVGPSAMRNRRNAFIVAIMAPLLPRESVTGTGLAIPERGLSVPDAALGL